VAAEATDGGIRIAKNVSGVRVNYAQVEGSLSGVWKSVCPFGVKALVAEQTANAEHHRNSLYRGIAEMAQRIQ
jgi:hypothetical protein